MHDKDFLTTKVSKDLNCKIVFQKITETKLF